MSGPDNCGDPIGGIFDKDETDQSYNFTNLRPYIRYKVQVIGINKGGASEPSEGTARTAESSRFPWNSNNACSSSSSSSGSSRSSSSSNSGSSHGSRVGSCISGISNYYL